MLQRFIAHNILECKGIITRLWKLNGPEQGKPVFKYIIHAAAKPSFIIRGKGKVEALGWRGYAGTLSCHIQPDIFIPVGISMPENNKNIIAGNSILYGKADLGFNTGAPCKTGNVYIFFKYIYSCTGDEINAECYRQ